MKKRIVSVILVLCLMVSLSVSAFAAELTPSADKTSVEAGSDVTVTLTLSEDIPDVTTIYYMLRYNGALYDFKSGAAGATAGVVVSDPMTDKRQLSGQHVRWRDDEAGRVCNARFHCEDDHCRDHGQQL